MMNITFAQNVCYGTFAKNSKSLILLALKERNRNQCSFVRVVMYKNSGRDAKSELLTVYRGRIEKVLDAELGAEVEVCRLDIQGKEVCVSSAHPQAMPMYRFNSDYTYMALKTSGRSKKVIMNFKEAKGSLAKVQICVGSTLSFTKEVRVLQPINGFYEVISVIVDGELLTFRANCCSPRQKKGKAKQNEPKLAKVEQNETKQAASEENKLNQPRAERYESEQVKVEWEAAKQIKTKRTEVQQNKARRDEPKQAA